MKIGEDWFDGTSWEAQVPADWSLQPNTGCAKIFESPNSATLQIGVRKNVELQGYGSIRVPADVIDPAQRRAYVLAAQTQYLALTEGTFWNWLRQLAARLFLGLRPRLASWNLGDLSGFVFEVMKDDLRSVSGYLAKNEWCLYVRFQAPLARFDSELITAKQILGTISFRA